MSRFPSCCPNQSIQEVGKHPTPVGWQECARPCQQETEVSEHVPAAFPRDISGTDGSESRSGTGLCEPDLSFLPVCRHTAVAAESYSQVRLSEGFKAFAALMDCRPDLGSKAELPRSRRSLQGWSKVDPAKTRPPRPFALVALIVVKLLPNQHWQHFSASLHT
jgi:hypothetical protein